MIIFGKKFVGLRYHVVQAGYLVKNYYFVSPRNYVGFNFCGKSTGEHINVFTKFNRGLFVVAFLGVYLFLSV